MIKGDREQDGLSRAIEALETLRPALESIDEAIVLADHRGTVRWANTAFMELGGFTSVPELPINEALPLRDYGRPLTTEEDPFMGALRDGTSRSGRFELHTARQVSIVAIKTVVSDDGLLVLGILRDLTERRIDQILFDEAKNSLHDAGDEISAHEGLLKLAMEDLKRVYDDFLDTQTRLMQADKLAAIGLLAAGIIHEINNPLACVSGTLAVLDQHMAAVARIAGPLRELRSAVSRGDLPAATQALKKTDEAERACNFEYVSGELPGLLKTTLNGLGSIERIVKSLKTFSRSDRGVLAPEDLNAVIDSVIDIVWNQIKYKAELVREFGDIPRVTCNAQQIGQVFMNLLVNASHAIQAEGKITIRTYVDANQVRVEISDTGSGIPQDVMKKIFEPFFTTKEAGKGTGLGLSISADIIKKHNGEITVQSEPGKGTCFTVSLPFAGALN